MKNLSYWASRHAPFAITLIVLCEIINAFNGFMLGATLLDGVPMAILHVSAATLVGLAVGVRRLSRTGAGSFQFRRWCLSGAFLGNFLLFGLLGGLMTPRLQPRDVSVGAWGSRRIESRVDTLARATTLRPVAPLGGVARADGPDNQTGKRIGFVLLFVLSIVLIPYIASLACNIACAGQGFLAAIVFMLGLGIPAGGIYFLGRTTERPIKKLREMTTDERRRAGRRFWLSWGLLIGIATLLLLVG